MSNAFSRRHLLQYVAASTLPGAGAAWSQDAYPSRPIKIIVPLPAGGAADASVRIMGEQLQSAVGQSVVIDNKPGGIFAIGMQSLAQAPADGYTLIHLNSGMVAAQAALRRYDLLRQLQPVSLMGTTDGILAAAPSAPFKTARELIEWARANPGQLNYGSAGPGSIEHLTAANFAKKYGFTATHVPFKGGPDAMTALARGEIHIFTTVVPLVYQFLQKGMVRPVAMMVAQRSPLLPDVSTLQEQGIELPPLQFWGGLAAPAGTSTAVVETLQRQIAMALASPALKGKYAGLGMMPASSNAEEFSRVISNDLKWMSAAVVAADLKFD